jgi:sulfite exporter TauE/SafE
MMAPTLVAALLLGLLASGHCFVMCGGITAALGIATAKGADGRPQAHLLAAYQVGRILSYVLAGLAFGGVLGSLVAVLDVEAVRRALRALSAAALLVAAMVVFGRVRDPGAGIGQRVWAKLAPIGRRLVPVTNMRRALAFGMVWGWMPCGMVYTMLLMASLQLDALHAAATMAAFGLGTVPAMLAAALGAQQLAGFSTRPVGRRIAGAVLVACALLTLVAPWLPQGAHLHLHG